MNTQEYISSGIVESYVLGLASDEERREFESMCERYPEVLEARTAFELALEKQAFEHAIAPAPALKDVIRATLFDTDEKAKVVSISAAPARSNWLRYAAAACVVLLAGSVFYNISTAKKLEQAQADNKALNQQLNEMIAKTDQMSKDMHVLAPNPAMKTASMKGTDMAPGSFATVYWDTTSHDVYLHINNLPTPATDQQYQLWAIFNGKPVDLGVFDIKKDKLLIQAKNAQGAEAFAISLEKRGGSQDPNGPQGKVYVMGKL